jgi:hypothetical protein
MRALAVSENPIQLRRPPGLPRLVFAASQLFSIVEDTRYDGEWKARTLAYIYSIQVSEPENGTREQEVIAWHWHPLTTPDRPAPHMHVRSELPVLGVTLAKLHIPSGRVSFEEVIRFLIEDFQVEAARDGWRTIIGDSEQRFKDFRTWS